MPPSAPAEKLKPDVPLFLEQVPDEFFEVEWRKCPKVVGAAHHNSRPKSSPSWNTVDRPVNADNGGVEIAEQDSRRYPKPFSTDATTRSTLIGRFEDNRFLGYTTFLGRSHACETMASPHQVNVRIRHCMKLGTTSALEGVVRHPDGEMTQQGADE
jgi:hypothetical protein